MPTLIAGLISGTSADGIDAVLAEFDTDDGRPRSLAAITHPYDAALRTDIESIIADGHRSIETFAALDARIGVAFSEAVVTLLADAGVAPESVSAIGSHGQTIGHFPGNAHRSTVQIGDPNRIAFATGIPVVADFRRADMAAGGQGAPFAPLFHDAVFASADQSRAILNLGGIANLTILTHGEVIGFDTGPANTLLDWWAVRNGRGGYDENGTLANDGEVDISLLERLMDESYFLLPPPKSTGREHFNMAWLERRLGDAASRPADVQATLAEFSARTIAEAMAPYRSEVARVYACGGGIHNGDLMKRIAGRIAPVELTTTAELGVDPDYVEALTFAWLAHERIHARSPVGLGAVTGSKGDPVLGGIWLPPRI